MPAARTVVGVDEVFGPAALLILEGDVDGLRSLLAEQPELADRRSSVGHPSLLQLVACEAAQLPDPAGAASVLVDAGAPLNEPLVAAAGCGAAGIVELLVDRGAAIDGDGSWTPLDEAVYWAKPEIARRLVERGAAVRALSTAAGLGSMAAVERFFDGDQLTDEAGPVASPFPDTVADGQANDPVHILDHAFVMAVNGGHAGVAAHLLGRGARVNAVPPGYHWRGTALHAACWRGDAALVTWLLAEGADPTIRDGLADSDAVGWARHHGHDELVDLLV